MKNIVHLFSRDVVNNFLDLRGDVTPRSKNFEFIAALLMHRVCELQWKAPAMIGFYIKQEYAAALSSAKVSDTAVFNDALANGIIENHPIDFVIASDKEFQEFQLKRFGLGNHNYNAGNLISYLNEMQRNYSPVDASCLVALTDIEVIDFPTVSKGLQKEKFPFSELLLVGVTNADKFIVASLLPHEGWSAYDLHTVVN